VECISRTLWSALVGYCDKIPLRITIGVGNCSLFLNMFILLMLATQTTQTTQSRHTFFIYSSMYSLLTGSINSTICVLLMRFVSNEIQSEINKIFKSSWNKYYTPTWNTFAFGRTICGVSVHDAETTYTTYK
jgi:hypothetical protein